MRAVLTFAIVCTFSFPALADEQREVTAALRKAIEAKKKSLPGEIAKAKQRLKGVSDAAKREAAAQELTALEELQKKLAEPNAFYVPEVDLPPKDKDWIGKIDSDGGELTVGAHLREGVYVLMWRREQNQKEVAILYKPGGQLDVGKATTLEGVFRIVGKNGTGQWQIGKVSQTLLDGAEAEITGKAKTP
jgi:hypothetical protein